MTEVYRPTEDPTLAAIDAEIDRKRKRLLEVHKQAAKHKKDYDALIDEAATLNDQIRSMSDQYTRLANP